MFRRGPASGRGESVTIGAGNVDILGGTILEAISRFALHHIGYAVKAIESISDSYVTRFGYAACTPVIHDPVQAALVQFLSLARDRVYLEFVSPDGPDSRVANAVRKGGGLNHLCYIVGDLERDADWLVKNGMMLISDAQPAVAFAGRRICWLMGEDMLPIELVEQSKPDDLCEPGLLNDAQLL
jgi:methylmalonyl-CoA/ethylmalonyl-CoA epimerase